MLVWSGAAGPFQTATALAELVDDFVPVPAGWWRQGGEVEVTRINGRGWFNSGVPYATAVAEALDLPAAELSGDTDEQVTPSPKASGGQASPSPSSTALPKMPAPDAEPFGDVDVVLGNDHASCLDGPPCPTPSPTGASPTQTPNPTSTPQESP